MEDHIFIRHDFVIEQDGQRLQDAICLPIDDYNKLSKDDIEKMKQQRFENWIKAINTPPPEISKEEQLAQVEQQLTDMEQQKEQLLSQKTQLQTAISAKPPIDVKPIKEG